MHHDGPTVTLPIVYTHMKTWPKIAGDYSGQMIYQLENQLAAAQKQLAFWKDFRQRLHLCKSCNGVGSFREVVEQIHSELHTCTACNGTGEEVQSD